MKTKFGFGLIVLGIGVFVAWTLWAKTRNETPLDVPVALIPGQTVTRPFPLNLDGLYLIEIAVESNIPPETLRCLMGVEANPVQCKNIAPAIGATWILFREGREIRRGSSLEPHSAPIQMDNVVRVIGEFPGMANRDYRLDVLTTTDGRSLQSAHPRLRVVISSLAKTDFQSADVLVFSICFICLMFGVILVGLAIYSRRPGQRGKHNQSGRQEKTRQQPL